MWKIREATVSRCALAAFVDFFQYGFCSLQNVVIPKAQYPVSLTLQVDGSLLVVKLLVCVLSAVQFDDEPVFKGGEVCNVLANGILATEFDAVESSGTQVTPQAVFCIRHVLPQCARVVLLLGIAVGGHGFCWVIGLGSVKGCSGFCRCAACLHPLPRPPPLRASPCSQLCSPDPSIGETKLGFYTLCGSVSSVFSRLAR